MSRPAPRALEVIQTRFITPNMLRVTLGGEGILGFPADQESAYIKLLFEQGEGQKPLMRTYTIRNQRENEIDVDFVVHDHPGPAGSWALGAQPGDRILVGGPGPRKLINPAGDWFLLVGDMTALPAISVNLALLPNTAQGTVVIEIASEADHQSLSCPPGVDIVWVVSRNPSSPGEALFDAVAELPWREGAPSVWCACEFSSMRRFRAYFREERATDPKLRYISSYWKYGLSEDQHKIVKREDESTVAVL
ncbi:siderophore-interacting protein [Microbulbifer sp. HZ11]|uniref:siderophore-interacting protein n=1 Tax=Microbulbifer sp. HZ11 TaxID=1453501 RepID=UPI0005BB10C9|nr:siderophore-interacting protein [Microbulbifer sp. HZ11]